MPRGSSANQKTFYFQAALESSVKALLEGEAKRQKTERDGEAS
jgi:hypothetical protein